MGFEDDYPLRRRGLGLFGVIVVSVLVSSAVSVVMFLLIQRGVLSLDANVWNESVVVPSLVDLSEEKARRQLEQAGLRMVLLPDIESADVEKGHVGRQEPLSGSQIHAGDEVKVRLSSGKPTAPVPTLRGMMRADAEAKIREAGFQVGNLSEPVVVDEEDTEAKPSVKVGEVIAVAPEEGVLAPLGTAIDLTIRGAPDTIEVPKLRGKSLGQARQMLESLDLAVGKVRRDYQESLPELIVLRHRPDAGEQVKAGTEIDIVIND